MKITRAVVPSLFTILNMFSGLLSIIHCLRQDYILAAWFIILAALFDTLDGVMARITKSSSAFGVEFDSLSDLVSFGVAPAVLVYQVHLHTLEGLGIIISSMIMIFGAFRLARFNVQLVGFDKKYFIGLPIPASALVITSFILTYYDNAMGIRIAVRDFLAPMVIILSLLMVSHVKYDTLPKLSRREVKKQPLKSLIFFAALVAVIVTSGRALFPVFVIFVMSGLIRYAVTTVKHFLHPLEKIEEEESEATTLDI